MTRHSDTNTLIIGAGMSGLLATAKLAQRGVDVTLCERSSEVGGLHANVRVGRHHVPLIAYKTLGLKPGTRLRSLLASDSKSAPSILRMKSSDHVFFTDGDVCLPAAPGALQECLEGLFPKEKTGIDRFMRTLTVLHQALVAPTRIGLSGEHIRLLRELEGKSYESFVQGCIGDPRLAALLSLRVFSSQNDVITMAVYLANVLWEGLYWIPSGSSQIVECLLGHIKKSRNAELKLNAKVSQLLTNDEGCVCGVMLAGGEEVSAENIVCAAAPSQFASMLPQRELRDETINCLAKAEPSLSSIIAIFVMLPRFVKRLHQHAHTARLLVCTQENIFDVYRRRESGHVDLNLVKVTWDHPEEFDNCEVQYHPRLYLEIDCHAWEISANVHSPVKQSIANQDPRPFLEILEHIFPHASEEVEAYRIITPADLESATANPQGSCSGWNNSARPIGLDKLFAKSGTHLIGQWSRYGTGLPMLEFSAEAICNKIKTSAQTGGV